MHLVLQAAVASPLVDQVPDILGSAMYSEQPALPQPFSVPKAKVEDTFFYEGQTAVVTHHGDVKRVWDCAVLTRGSHPAHAKDPEATYEVGNATPAHAISPGCVCLPRSGFPRGREVISPTQRDLGPGMCTNPCLEASRFPYQVSDAWCGAESIPQRQQCGVCMASNCTVFGGEPFAPRNKLTLRVHSTHLLF